MAVIVSAALCAASGATMSGCESSKEVAGDTAARTIREFQTSLDKTPAQIDRVMGTLNELTSGNAVNHEKLAKDFSNQLKTLVEQGKSLAAERDRAEASTQTYFRKWVQESRGFKSAADRDAAIAMMDTGRANTETAMSYLRNGSRDFRALIDQLTGIEATLGAHPTPDAVATVSRNLGPVFDNANMVKNYIARLNEQIDASLMGR